MTRKLRNACAALTAAAIAAAAPAAWAVWCSPSYDQGVVTQSEYPHTSCRWNDTHDWWDPPSDTQMQIQTQAGDCILLNCAATGPVQNGAWIGKLTNYSAPWQGGSWDNRVYWSQLGSRVEGHFKRDQCGQGQDLGPQWGPSTQWWDTNGGLTASISSVQCWLYR